MERFAIDEVLCFKVSKGLPSFFFPGACRKDRNYPRDFGEIEIGELRKQIVVTRLGFLEVVWCSAGKGERFGILVCCQPHEFRDSKLSVSLESPVPLSHYPVVVCAAMR